MLRPCCGGESLLTGPPARLSAKQATSAFLIQKSKKFILLPD
jgi:hypothetical protein